VPAGELVFNLHALIARLDRAADHILSTELGLSYRRFMPLFMVRELGATTQRALAERLEVSEPSVSRMTTVLSEAGLLVVEQDPDGGNRRRLRLTPEGDELVDTAQALLARRFEDVLERSGIPALAYARHTKALLSSIDARVAQPAA
jgi:DNA-binding MarR family transcriptional regulator